jgi:hypothetical protein
MNDELVKQLKENGFPLPIWEEYPTLSELIEACGYGFRSLSRHTEYNLKREKMGLLKEGRIWLAKAGKKSGGFLKNGHTPEEAVAKLYLALNSK